MKDGELCASVVVRQHNELKHLKRLFESIRRQRGVEVELIVVDSGSTDGSRELAAEHADQLIDISPQDFTFGYSLNQGIRLAKAPFIVIVSAHTYPTSEQWIQSLLAPFKNDEICMSYGRQIGLETSNPAEISDFERFFGAKAKTQSAPDYFCNNANSAIRKSLWEKHSFDESLSGLEDMEWAKHHLDKGHRLAYVPEAEIVHIHNETLRQIENRFFREALALRRMGLKSRHSLLKDLAAEGKKFLSDSRKAVGDKNPIHLMRQTVSYRWSKSKGHARGLIRGKFEGAPLSRELREIIDVKNNLSVTVEAPGRVVLREMSVPEIAPNDVLIQPAYVGICGTDREIAHGTLGYYREGIAQYPIVLGHEYSGRVAKTGVKVSNLKPGDQVVGECILTCGRCAPCRDHRHLGCDGRQEVGVIGVNGALANYVKIPATRVHRIPEGLSLQRAALSEPLAVVIHALRLAALWPAASVQKTTGKILLLGGGSLGHLAARALSECGNKNFSLVERSEYKRKLLGDLEVEIFAALPVDGLKQYSTILDFTGNGQLISEALAGIGAQTNIVCVGFPYEGTKLSLERMVSEELRIQGSLGAQSEDFKDALELLSRLRIDPYLENTFALNDFQAALEASKRDTVLKAMITILP